MIKQKYVEVSLFNGIGGFSVATEKSGLNIIKRYVSEIDKFANKCYFGNYDAVQLGDVTMITKDDIDEINAYAYDNDAKILFSVGSPCQDLSTIGKMRGLDSVEMEIHSLDDYLEAKRIGATFKGQSYLFYEAVRIKELLNYDFVMFENVRMSKENVKKFTEALGLPMQYVDSIDVSPQSRKRMYWSNYSYTPVALDDRVISDILDDGSVFVDKPNFLNAMYGKKRRIDHCSNINSKCHTLTASMYKGNIASYVVNDSGLVKRLSPTECERLQGFDIDGYTKMLSNTQRYKTLGNSFNIPSICGFLNGYIKGEVAKIQHSFEF